MARAVAQERLVELEANETAVVGSTHVRRVRVERNIYRRPPPAYTKSAIRTPQGSSAGEPLTAESPQP
jgi:hypothetical protein